jgi:hypothetical protein
LLALLNGPSFIIVRSEVLQGKIVFWTASDEGRDQLVANGAPRGSVWTYEEFDALSRFDAQTMPGVIRVNSRFGCNGPRVEP